MIVVRVAQVLLKEPPKYYNLGCHTLKTWQLLHTKAAEGFFRGFHFNSVLKNEGRVFSFYGTHFCLFVCLFFVQGFWKQGTSKLHLKRVTG